MCGHVRCAASLVPSRCQPQHRPATGPATCMERKGGKPPPRRAKSTVHTHTQSDRLASRPNALSSPLRVAVADRCRAREHDYSSESMPLTEITPGLPQDSPILRGFVRAKGLWPCSLPMHNQNISSSTYHIESLDACMKH
jgi:hypothetical protein